MGNWKIPVKTNKDLIELAFKQIEQETGFHIIDKEYNEDKYTKIEDQDTICEFHILEIPGFKFAFWNTRIYNDESKAFDKNHIEWMNSLEIDYNSELIFFTQYERDLDKFKPSRSGFVIGISRTQYIKEPDPKEEEIEYFNMWDLTKALNYIKKHRIRAVEYSGCQVRYVWEDDRSYLSILKTFMHDWLYHWKSEFKDWLKIKKCIRVSKRHMKKLTQFNYIIKDQGSCCYPRIEVLIRRKEQIDIEQYEKEWDIIEKFDDKYGNLLTFNWLQYDINETSTEDIIKKDKACRDNFFWHCNAWKNKVDTDWIDEDSKLIEYNVEIIPDLDEVIKRKEEELKKYETSSNT